MQDVGRLFDTEATKETEFHHPNRPEAYLHYGGLMEALGRLDRGLQLKQQALERDPTSALTLVLIAVSFWNQRRYDDAIAWLNKALEREPTHVFARELRSAAYFKTGDLERAFGDDLKHAEALDVPEATLAAMRRVHAKIKDAYEAGGYREAMRCILKHTPDDPMAEAVRGFAHSGVVGRATRLCYTSRPMARIRARALLCSTTPGRIR